MNIKIIYLKKKILENLQHQWTVKKMAETVEVTPAHLQKIFKVATGMSPMNYLHNLRLEKAKELLEKSFMYIHIICWEVGIKDPHFTFHAMVKLNNKYYDPSYGTDLLTQADYPFTDVALQEIVDLVNPNNPRFRSGNSTTPFVVKALTMRNFCILPNCSTNTVVTNELCPHSW